MQSPIINNKLYNLSLFEVCEILSKSSRTITRYIKNGILHPVEIKSRKGMPEYRFCREEIDAFKARENQWRQPSYTSRMQYVRPDIIPEAPVLPSSISTDNQNLVEETSKTAARGGIENIPITSQAEAPIQNIKPEIKAETRQDEEIITLLKETTEILRDQLKAKDDQIKNLDEKIGQLIERNRETNILLKGLQDKIGLLDSPKPEKENQPTFENIPQPQTQAQGQEHIQAQTQPQPQTQEQTQINTKQENKTGQQSKRKKKNNPTPKKGFFTKLFS